MKERPVEMRGSCTSPSSPHPKQITRRNLRTSTKQRSDVKQRTHPSQHHKLISKACSIIQSQWLILLIALSSSLVEFSSGFNLSPEAALIFEEPGSTGDPGARESYFGYSVGLRSRKRYNDNWLLVGAPRANLTPTPLTPVGLVEPGAMYKCPVGLGGGSCKQVLLDDTGNTASNLWSGELGYHDLKDHGWLGGTMDTQDSDREATMVCAPLWKNQLYPSTFLMNGACYDQDSELQDATAQKRLPLTQFSQQNYQVRGKHTVFHYAHGQLGMSMHFPEDESRVLLGAPGVFNWQGTVVELRDAVLSPPGSISRRRRQAAGVRPQSRFSIEFVPNPYFTGSISDADYFGYSVGSGTFIPGETHYVGGAPRGANSKGKVLVFQMGQMEESELQILVERSGDQIGEYFGAALTATDLNNDGLADLVVGAPLHSTAVSPDHGAIYYFSNNGGGQLSLHGVKIEGTTATGARFGSTLAAPGDLNKDGYNDLVVGAPYEGPGAVYVYLGSVDGLRQQFSQRISAEGFKSTSGRALAGFGFSISRGVDVDDNQYPDIAVGSYVSGHAVLLRTRPVAVLEGSTTTTPTRLTLFDTTFTATACVTYKGIGVPQFQNVTVLVSLDHQRQLVAPRAIFTDTNTAQYTYNVTLQRNGRQCKQLRARVQSERNNAPDPVGIRLQYWLADSSLLPSETARPTRQFLPPDAPSPPLGPITSPVTDPSERTGRTSFLSFVTGCEDDGDPSCRSDMRIRAWWPSHPDRLVVGKQKRIKMAVTIENHGEPAFLPNVTFSVKRPLDLLLPATHTCERLGTDYPSIMCRLENPLLLGKQESLELEVDVEQLSDSSTPVEVRVVAGSSDIEVTPSDNTMNAALPLAADAQLALYGSSTEEQVTYPRISPSVINTTVIQSLSFVHRLTIVKRGPTPLGEVSLQVEIPLKDAANNTLLTLHAPEREFQGEQFPCRLEGGQWITAKKGAAVNLTDAGDSALSAMEDSSTAGQSRRRRQAPSEQDVEKETVEQRPVPLVSCRALPTMQCAVMHCTIGSWPHDSDSASIAYRLNLNLTTLGALIGVKDGTIIASEATVTIRSLASSILFDGDKTSRGSAHTTVQPGRLAGEGVPWWWYLLAILLGLLLLSALIYGLYKLGFFKRKEKEEMAAMSATLTSAENENYGASSD